MKTKQSKTKTRTKAERTASSRSGRVVRMRASSANELLGTWELRRNAAIKTKDEPAYRHKYHRELWLVREAAINECIEDFRRVLAHPMKRQPHPNTSGQTRPAEPL